jgi:LysR family transcriptional regulator, low CO2-responsive transcriptional regulator
MNLTQLRAFHVVAQAGGFSLAARTEDLSQPTLSAQVCALEAGYGVGLFDRKGRGVQMTPAGQSLYAVTTRLFAA